MTWLDSLLDISWNRIITFRHPRQVPVPVTLLKDFDPMFHREKKAKEAEGEEEKKVYMVGYSTIIGKLASMT